MAIDHPSFLDIVVLDSPRPGIREPTVATATGGHETRGSATAPSRRGQAVLGICIQDLAEGARRTAHRQARHGGPLATGPVSKALGSQVPVQRTSQDRTVG